MDKFIVKTLDKYFDTLSKLGYMPYNNVYEILLVIHLNRLNSENFKRVLSQEEINKLDIISSNVLSNMCPVC